MGSSPLEMVPTNFLNSESETNFPRIREAIETIRGTALNQYEQVRLEQLKNAIGELIVARQAFKESKLGFPEVCYQAARKTSQVLTQYGFRHKLISNFD